MSINLFDKKLKDLQEKVNRKNYLTSIMDSLYVQRVELKNKVGQLDKKRLKEQKDVEKIEGGSLAAFFYEMVGKQEAKLSKERKEAYEAQVKYDTAMQEWKLVEDDIRSYERELDALENIEKEYRAALDKKIEESKNLDIPEAKLILELSEKNGEVNSQLKEIKEALDAGWQAHDTAQGMLKELEDAESWGTYDLLGGGMIAGMLKHEHVDKAQKQVKNLQLAIRSFNTELADISGGMELDFRIGEILKFADIWFDNFFTDIMVQNNIETSISSVKNAIDQIDSVMKELEEMQEEKKTELEKLEKELENLALNLN